MPCAIEYRSPGTVTSVSTPRVTAVAALCLTTLTTALSLSACSISDSFGPKPNQALLGLARQTSADADVIDDGTSLDGIRKQQADALYDEIARLCGRESNGAVPRSCSVDRGANGISGTKDTSTMTSSDLNAADHVPAESKALVISQAIDLSSKDAPTSLPEPPSVTLLKVDKEILTDLLKREHGVVAGLDVASAYTKTNLSTIRDHHDQRRVALAKLIGDGAPAAEPGYKFASDPAKPSSYLDDTAKDMNAAWRQAATQANDPQVRAWLVNVAAMLSAGSEK